MEWIAEKKIMSPSVTSVVIFKTTVHFPYLETCRRGVKKWGERKGQGDAGFLGYLLFTWHKVTVKNAGFKYIRWQYIRSRQSH
jgi:hypothetical protein